jgi:hypothetical protein
MILNEEPEYIIEHYGKQGMKWGVRRDSKTGVRPIAKTLDKSKVGKAAAANVDRSMARSRNRELNKASRAKDVKTIEAARARVKSGQTKADFKNAKAAHAENKRKLGTREAKRLLYEARDKRYEEIAISRTAKNGKEVAISVATGVGALVAYVAISTALNR